MNEINKEDGKGMKVIHIHRYRHIVRKEVLANFTFTVNGWYVGAGRDFERTNFPLVLRSMITHILHGYDT